MWLRVLPAVVISLGPVSLLAHDTQKPFSPEPSVVKIEKTIEEIRADLRIAQSSGAPADAIDSAQAIYANALLWKKSVVTVCFWNGTDDLKNEVIAKAKVWPETADISLAFHDATGTVRKCTNAKSADIRISLEGNDPQIVWESNQDPKGDWSKIGKMSGSSLAHVTMSLAGLSRFQSLDDTISFNFVIRHEFGHALGLMHEHQRDVCRGWFDIKKIAQDAGVSEKVAQQNVEAFMDSDAWLPFKLKTVGEYDKNSIMQYNFAPTWYKKDPQKPNPCKRDDEVDNLSPKDVAGIQRVYGPRAGVASASTSIPNIPTPLSHAASVLPLQQRSAASALVPIVPSAPAALAGQQDPSVIPLRNSLSEEAVSAHRARLSSTRTALNVAAQSMKVLAAAAKESSAKISTQTNTAFCMPNPFGSNNCIHIRPENLPESRALIDLEAEVKTSQAQAAADALGRVIDSLDRLDALTKAQ